MRIYLIFEGDATLQPASDRKGLEPLKTKLVLNETQKGGACGALIQWFCAEYDKQNKGAGLLDPAMMNLKVGDTVLRANMAPVTQYIAAYNDVFVQFAPLAERTRAKQAAAEAVAAAGGAVRCANYGCGSLYTPGTAEGDAGDACRYHTGHPVFHDLHKYWSCCPDKKCMEFEAFERVAPCAVGRHRAKAEVEVERAMLRALEARQAVDRAPLSVEQAAAMAAGAGAPVYEAAEGTAAVPNRGPREFTLGGPDASAPGVARADGSYACRHTGCNAKFFLDANPYDACRYHTGKPVFHDAYKYWSCCPDKKCHDFDAFMKVEGCCVGPHLQ
jgi:hypothetical protein